MSSIIPDVSAHMLTLASTGFTLGLVHVLAGPDHLSALAALAVGTSWKAFMLGFRWGIGHSTGLIVVAVIFIILKGDLDLRIIGRYCDSLVGAFMIGLGCYGVIGALKLFREKKAKRDPDWEHSSNHVNLTNRSIHTRENNSEINYDKSEHSKSELGLVSPVNIRNGPKSGDVVSHIASQSPFSSNCDDYYDDVHIHVHVHDYNDMIKYCPFIPYIDMHDPVTQQIISFSIGLLHGVAGPGGILGVLPAVEMQNWRYSCVYLGSFIFSSTISMGTFAALYGELTRRLGATAESVELGLSVFSAAMSMAVGATWLVLSILGKLDSLFH